MVFENQAAMSTVSFGPPERQPRTAARKAIRFVIACAMLALAAYAVYGTGLVAATRPRLWIGAGALAIYLLAAYYVDLEPDYENLGCSFGGRHSNRLPIFGWLRFDDPFQWSDDVSREFLFYRLLLSPGRFISIALTDPLFPESRRRHDEAS
jgi:hypothetical protein